MSSKQRSRKQKQKKGSGRARDPALVLRREFPKQPITQHVIEGTPVPLTTTVTTGVVSHNTNISVLSIPQFSARFIGYESCRIVKAVATINTFGSTLPGVYRMWFDEDTSGAPSATQALSAEARTFPISDTRKKSLVYVPHDPSQQNFQQVSVGSQNYGFFKLYTDTTNYGSPTAATPVMLVQITYTVQFRGFA